MWYIIDSKDLKPEYQLVNVKYLNQRLAETEQDIDEHYVQKEKGKGLSTNDYITDDKTKLSGIENNAEVNVQADWNEVDSAADSFIKNKPTIPDVSNFITKNVNDLTYYTLGTDTGSTIDLEIDSSTYVVTLSLKNSAGTTISTDTIDLPLESVVVNGSYDSTNKKIVLTLQSGSTIEIPVGDLVSGLQTEITSNNKLSADLVDDTNKTNKFVTTSEKTTWNNKYDKPNNGIPSSDLSSAVQTSLGKADTAIQSSDLATVATSGDYDDLLNKPTLFSGNYEDLTNKPTIPTVPTNVSSFTNDSGYLVSNDLKTINNQSIVGSGDITISSEYAVPVYCLRTTSNFSSGTKYTGSNFSSADLQKMSNIITDAYANGYFNFSLILSYENSGYYNDGFAPFFLASMGSTLNKRTSIIFFSNALVENRYVRNDTRKFSSAMISIIGSWDGDTFTATRVKFYNDIYDMLTLDNEKSYTPTTDYHPATKKYVDDAITGTITSVKMNGTTISSSGEADLGTVITQHQDISGKEDKTNKVTSISSSSTDTEYPSAKAVYTTINNKFFYINISSSNTTTITWNELYEAYSNDKIILAKIDYVEGVTTIPVVVPLYSIIGTQSGGTFMFTFVMGSSSINYMVTGTGDNTCTITKQEKAFEETTNKVQSVVSNSASTTYYPSTKAVYNEFQRKPVVIWESNDPNEYLKGIQANLSASPAWQLTDLDMTPYKRIKIYSCAGKGSTNASTTPAIILEMSLDSRAASTELGNNYVASTVIQKSNDNNRLATLTCAVSSDKTSFVVLWQTSLYGTAGTSNNDVNANVFMIEGYYD